jgi:hypothetical protein
VNWTKRGLIYSPSRAHEWNQSHAQVPTVDLLGDRWRIYYATRNGRNQSSTSFIDVAAGHPERVLYEHDRPILDPGKLGAFDDCGIMPAWIVTVDSRKYLFYIGWTVRTTVPYHNSIGLAVSDDGGVSFQRVGDGPLFGPTLQEPYFTGTACVLREAGIWKIWYLSCTGWTVVDDHPEPRYHLKYAESKDGLDWQRDGIVAIDYRSDEEGGIASASVIREARMYRMWYSYRLTSGYRTDKRASYRIGYAESDDGKAWVRNDPLAGIDVSEAGWDAEMIAYPHVVSYGGQMFMFYNGNGFGRDGFGYATVG